MSRKPRHQRPSTRPSTRPSGPTGPTRPFRSIESRLGIDDHLAIEESAAAELRGDWQTAFERHRSVALFGESVHGAHLRLLADLGDDAPDWLVARFVTTMAHRLELYGQTRRSSRVLQTMIPLLYPHGIPFASMGCEHVQQVPAQVFGRDWVVRQADVHELGGLADLLHLPAASGAVARAGQVAAWTSAPMGGYRLVGTRTSDGVLVLADALTGAETEVLDLGATEEHDAGTHVLARVVPTAAPPGRVLDDRPLRVDEATARAVAEHPERWLRTLAARAASRHLPAGFALLEDGGLGTDLPRHAWGALLGLPVDGDLPRHPGALVAEALGAALRLADDADAVRARRHVVAALLIDDELDDGVLTRFARPTYRDAWRVLADTVPAHARPRCDRATWLIEAGRPEGRAS